MIASGKTSPVSSWYKWEVLALLWVAFFINQADRQVFNVVLPLIKAEFDLNDVQLGWIATVFNLVYAILVMVAGFAGDLWSKKWILVGSILFWSVATMLTGFGTGILSLMIFRSLVGAGEAFFGPSNYSLLAGYHKETRGTAMAIHQTSYYLGVISSGLVAGYIGQHYGWRNTFYVFGLVGILHGLVLAWRLKDPPGAAVTKLEEKVKWTESLKIIFTTPTALLLTISFSGLIFVLVGYLTWTPTLLYETFGMDLTSAGFQSMVYTHLCAFVGILIAGKLSDVWAVKKAGSRLLIQAAGLLGAVPFIILMGNATSYLTVYIGLMGFGFCRAFFDANTYPVLFDVIPKRLHASASGTMAMVAFSIGSISPVVLGWLKTVFGLSTGISLLSIVWVVCGCLMIIAYRFYFKKDRIVEEVEKKQSASNTGA